MDIQKILLPRIDICTTNAMYFHCKNDRVYDLANQYLHLRENDVVVFDTYFNSVSIGKWNKYTIINNLTLELDACGDFEVQLEHCERINNSQFNHTLQVEEFHIEQRGIASLSFPMSYSTGIYYFRVIAKNKDTFIWGGKYSAEIGVAKINEVHLSLAICTYKKEEYIQRNLDKLSREILSNNNSVANGHFSVFVVDNGKSLDVSTLSNDNIYIYPNLNVGGTGGFARALIEILNCDNPSTTHVIFTDDDIVFEPDIFARTYSFLVCLREEFQHCSIGGSTLCLEKMNIQHTRGDCWNGGFGRQHNVKAGYDLSRVDNLLKNEMEEPVQYNAWLFSCVPIKTVKKIGMPLPIFIHRDDVEYGLRSGAPVIHLNGIGAWHSFGAAYSGANIYYDIRNALIVNALHRPDFPVKAVTKYLRKKMKDALLRFRYREMDLMFRGVEDFCKGIDWLKSQDPITLNKEISKVGYVPAPSFELPIPVNFPAFWRNFSFSESKMHKMKRLLTLNGWIGRSKRTTTVSLIYCRPINFYGVKRVLQYNQVNDTGVLTEKSYRELLRIILAYEKTKRLLYKNILPVSLEYRERYKEIASEAFWLDYLHLNETDCSTGDICTSPIVKFQKRTSRLSWVRIHAPVLWDMLYRITHPAPFSYRAALGTHMKIIGCWLLKNLHMTWVSSRMAMIEGSRGRHEGERCFIVGNGPSLRIEDLEKLVNEVTFATNSIYLALDKTQWRPDYYVFIDYNGYQKLEETSDFVCGEIPKKEAFLSSRISPKILTGKERFCHINHGNHTKRRMLTRRMKNSKDIAVCLYDLFTVTIAAIEIAMHMGFKEIYLIGVDCDYSREKIHFIETESDNEFRYNPVKRRLQGNAVSYMQDAYKFIDEIAKENGVKIYNATRGGALDAFERVDFDSISFR